MKNFRTDYPRITKLSSRQINKTNNRQTKKHCASDHTWSKPQSETCCRWEAVLVSGPLAAWSRCRYRELRRDRRGRRGWDVCDRQGQRVPANKNRGRCKSHSAVGISSTVNQIWINLYQKPDSYSQNNTRDTKVKPWITSKWNQQK